ncbi:hypothetical protein ACWCW0_34630, partial [Streptomyces sp. NPDC001758]
MRVRTLTGGLAAALVMAGPALTGPVAAVPSADSARPLVADRVLTYDARAAAAAGARWPAPRPPRHGLRK